jgi:hypothetical protein
MAASALALPTLATVLSEYTLATSSATLLLLDNPSFDSEWPKLSLAVGELWIEPGRAKLGKAECTIGIGWCPLRLERDWR